MQILLAVLGFWLGQSVAQHQHDGHGTPAIAQGTWRSAPIELVLGWVRLAPPTLSDTTVYFTLQNQSGQNLRLTGASSPVARMVMLMEDYREKRQGQEVAGMREMKVLTVPRNGRLELKPGGQHLMLMGLKQALREGDRIPIRLLFEGNLETRIELRVERR